MLGFAGRSLRDDHRPKYLNTAEGELFHKGQQLFGADVARAAASKTQAAILVEGYTDVIAMHQAGIENAVGMMGTALTERQVGELARLVGPGGILHIALDADASGQEAMLRAGELAAGRDLRLDVVVLPGSSDPADLLAREGVAPMRERVQAAVPLATFRVQRVLAKADLESTEGRNRAFDALRRLIGALPPSPEREDLVRLAASRLGLSEKLAGLLTVAPEAPRSDSASAGSAPAAPLRMDPREEGEHTFLAMCIALPDRGRDALRRVDLDAHFTTARLRRAAAHLRGHLTSPTEGLEGEDADLAPLMAELTLRAAAEPWDAASLDLQALQLEKRRLEREIASASAEGRPEVSALAAEKQRVQQRIDSAMADR